MSRLKMAVALAAMAGSIVAGAAGAADTTQPAREPKAQSSDAQVNVAQMNAMRVVVDKDTGEVRAPTEDELRALIEAEKAATAAMRTSRSAKPDATQIMPAQKQITVHKNGMVSMRMSQDSLSAIKAQTDATGKTRVVHEGEPLNQAAAQEK